jgi:curli production assembly/transport component CsgG
MNRTIHPFCFAIIFLSIFTPSALAQETTTVMGKVGAEIVKTSSLRSSNVVFLGGGTAIINGDIPDPMFEIYGNIGYRHFLGNVVALSFSYHKFNLAYKEVFNEGFMSFDLNAEVYLMPQKKFTPYLFAGGGLHAANYFDTQEIKVQVGLGVEYIIGSNVGITLFGEYNYLFTDEVENVIGGESDDAYWRAGLGLNFYLGKKSKRKEINDDEPSVINSNPIIHVKN